MTDLRTRLRGGTAVPGQVSREIAPSAGLPAAATHLEEIRMNDHLRQAMAATDIAELDTLAEEIGAAAMQTALSVRPQAPSREDEAAREKQLADAAEQRQRDQDAALADAIETVSRHRARLGRKTCSAHDGATIRKVFELLRGLTPGAEEGP
jgi:hypothetical protein